MRLLNFNRSIFIKQKIRKTNVMRPCLEAETVNQQADAITSKL